MVVGRRGVVTFVLTDIVGSTQLWQSAPDAVEEALAVHDRVIAERSRATAEGHAETPGLRRLDVLGFLSRASDGVRAAYGAQVALSGYAWPEGAHLRVRVAVHSGEAVERDGDYVGTTVNRAARRRAVAEGGER